MVTKEIDKVSGVHKKLKEQNDEFKVPEVLDYVHLKAELYEIDKKVQDWQRKVSLQFLCFVIYFFCFFVFLFLFFTLPSPLSPLPIRLTLPPLFFFLF